MKDLNYRYVHESDEAKLKEWMEQHEHVVLELPRGFVGPSTDTLVAFKDEEMIASMTGQLVLLVDPLIKNPDASSLDIAQAVMLLGRHLEAIAQKSGAVEGYVAIPHSMPGFLTIMKKLGYVETAENCTILKREL